MRDIFMLKVQFGKYKVQFGKSKSWDKFFVENIRTMWKRN